jgi:hypothetical protein
MAVSALLLRDSKKIQKLTCKVLLFAVYRNQGPSSRNPGNFRSSALISRRILLRPDWIQSPSQSPSQSP